MKVRAGGLLVAIVWTYTSDNFGRHVTAECPDVRKRTGIVTSEACHVHMKYSTLVLSVGFPSLFFFLGVTLTPDSYRTMRPRAHPGCRKVSLVVAFLASGLAAMGVGSQGRQRATDGGRRTTTTARVDCACDFTSPTPLSASVIHV